MPELNEHLQLHAKPLTAPLVIQKVLFYSLALFWAAEFVLSQAATAAEPRVVLFSTCSCDGSISEGSHL